MYYELKSRTFAAEMVRKAIIMSMLVLLSPCAFAQGEDDGLLPQEPVNYKLKLQRFRYVKPVVEKATSCPSYGYIRQWYSRMKSSDVPTTDSSIM